MADYIALIRKEKKSCYGVEFPDFPGCVTAGETLEEVKALAKEVLEFHILGMLEDGEALPAPSSLDRVMQDPANREAVVYLVSAGEPKLKTMRVNVTVPQVFLQEIDDYVRRHPSENRSRLFVRGARAVIHGRDTSIAKGRSIRAKGSKPTNRPLRPTKAK